MAKLASREVVEGEVGLRVTVALLGSGEESSVWSELHGSDALHIVRNENEFHL